MANNTKVQVDLMQRIQRAKDNFKKSPKERLRSKDYLNTRYQMLESLWEQFSLTHTQIVLDTEPETLQESAYVSNEVYNKTEELYIDYSFEIKSALSALEGRSSTGCETTKTGAEPSTSNIRLPKITIPVFSGKYSEWTTFYDLFRSLIHNNKSLDDVQKLHYLKGHLVGEAEQLVRHISVTKDNYRICWEQLEKRYNNKKYLANLILKRLMSQRNLTSESANGIKELLDTTNECLHALENIGVNVSSWDIIIIHIICLKLDPETRKQWELKCSELSEDLPTLPQFYGFLETRFRALEFVEPKTFKGTSNSFSNKSSSNCFNKGSNAPTNPKIHHVTAQSCMYCSEDHKICNCKSFAKIDTDARRDFVQSNRLCFNCLGVNHSVFACRQSTRCRICQKKHHSLLHPRNTTSATDSQVSNQSVERSVAVHNASASLSARDESNCTEIKSHFSTSRNQVLLATALVKAQSRNGSGITLRCLLDQGSQASLITESAVQLLGLKKIQHNSTISGLGSDEGASLASKAMVKVNIQSLLDPRFNYDVNAFVLNKLTADLPEKAVVVELWSALDKFELADPSFDRPNKIDMLLGADVYGQIIEEGIIKGSSGAPVAQKTTLGWILSGPIHAPDLTKPNHIKVNHVQVSDNELLKKFWELETDIPLKSPNFTDEEIKCEELFKTTTKRDSTGRYIVKLPFRDEDPSCKYGNSEAIATRRFLQLERRFAKDPQLKARYTDVIEEYLELGHMEQVAETEKQKDHVVYLPHHAVIREDKTTSKLRVVFDASCPGTNGVSLNQDLLVGPALQADLRHIILKWRMHPICLVADIVKMYRQVKVHEVDADFQRIVWRAKPDDEIGHFKLLRVTFGTASAPYLAVRALHQVAYDEGANLPLAAERVLNHFYMDDLLTGCQTVEEGKKIYKELIELLEKGGFELQKWTTNNEELLQEIEKENLEITESLQLKIDSIMKILGLTWNRSTDEFEYAVQLPPPKTPLTKRNVISDIARLFDPLGWLAPVIISAKVFIQKIWLSGIEWDDEIPTELLKEWLTYRETLGQLTKFKLPRWINTSNGDETLELHGFCDASSEAYAAVVYARVVDKHGDIHISLVTAKTKVAPIKQVSIPRLELCGAVLVARLLIEVSEVMGIDKMNIHAWTDSTIVLSWLNSRPNRWKTFVANRVSEIITSMEPQQWSHVVSKENPADYASRGTYQSVDELLWKEGPAWLKQKNINYKKFIVKETTLEERGKKLCFLNTCENNNGVSPANELMSRFSSLRKLIRVMAFCKRFTKLCQGQAGSKWLTSPEIRDSLLSCIKLVQQEHFQEEILSIKNKKCINKKSKLTSVNPTLDHEEILRVGGRLQHAQISEAMKHPIILPHKSHLTDLVVADAHQKTLHGAPQLMLNYLRSKYWIVGAKKLVNLFVRRCVICIRYAAATQHQLMGQLPSARSSITRPFCQSGVDYAGPINIRTSKGRGHHAYKGYICLFICMATRAIHLEPVSDLTSQGFLAAFKRFVARRGRCTDLWSDNGTNFVGAARELKHLFADEKSSMLPEIIDDLATNGTHWHFIPPHSPNFGGLWEAGIKSTKYHLKRVIGNSTLTYEEMATVLSQVEACLNSRPMSKLTDNSNDPMPLTPGHFLVGEPLVLAPDYNYEAANINNLRRWQLTQRMVQDFWRRWSREYLTQFYHRYKWGHQKPEPVVGDVVLIKEDDLPPGKWLYGRITDKHPGLDGITRVVSLKYKGGIIKGSVGKICVLPIET